MKEMTIVSQSGSSVVLKFNNEKKPYTVEDILSVHSKVYSDQVYFINVCNSKEISNLVVYVNGEASSSDYRDNLFLWRKL